MIAIVDYGAGNVASVQKALTFLGNTSLITSDPARIRAATQVIVPGQGHFGQAMQQLRTSGLDHVLREVVARGTPFLGICLGLQLLFEGSDEAPGVAGLGLLAGRCQRFGSAHKVPHMGWNRVTTTRAGSPFDHVLGNEYYYFAHSFYAVATNAIDAVAHTDYGGEFVAAVQRGNILATQFHPEKSGQAGLRLLRHAISRGDGAFEATVRVRIVRPGGGY